MKYMNEFSMKPGALAEYTRRHDEIWPEMISLIRDSGLENYTIWNTGTRLIEYFECGDIAASFERLRADPVKARWDEYMRDILVFGESGKPMPLKCLFDIENFA